MTATAVPGLLSTTAAACVTGVLLKQVNRIFHMGLQL